MKQYDCFAHTPERCIILNKKKCKSCAFYQTTEQQQASLAGAYARLASLDVPAQMHIAAQYYGGAMPWHL